MTDTYLDLRNAIQRELYNRTDLTTEIEAAIYSAIYTYQKHKFWFSEEQDTATTVNEQSSLALPSDFGFVDGVTIIYSTYPIRMERRDIGTMQDLIFNSNVLLGQPTDYAIWANQIWFWPTPNGAYTITLYENFLNAPPVADGDSSSWTMGTQAEELIRSRSIADIMCHVLKRQDSLLEAANLRNQNQPFLSMREKIAYDNLNTFSQMKLSARIKPIAF